MNPTRRELDRLFKALRPLEDEYDLIVIDHGAGIGYSTSAHLAATSTLVLVTNHEVTALSDAYALYKRAHMLNPHVRVGIVMNRAPRRAPGPTPAGSASAGRPSGSSGTAPSSSGGFPRTPRSRTACN